MSDGNWIEVTDHAAARWKTRSEVTNIGPRVAWFDAPTVPEPHGLDADEVRYYPSGNVVLLRRGSALVTVIDLTGAKPCLRAAVRKLGDIAQIEL